MEKFYNIKIKINKEQNNHRLDQALAKLSNFTRSQIKILLINENIKTDKGLLNNASYRVKEGEIYNLNLSNEEFFEGGLRNIIDKDFKKFSEGGIKQKTIKNMVLLHNNKLSKDYITKGLIVPNDIIEKLGLNSSEAATATTRLSQHYGGFDFGFDELKNIRRNAKASNKLFEAMNKFAFGNPYRSSLYRTSLELIDAQLGNERGTFSSLKNKARKVLKTNGIKGFDINEIAGVTGTARTGVGEFSQFMDVMDSNLNQKEMASFQSAFSRARENIKNNPENFATQSKQINKLAADFERRYNVKLPRIRNAADVEKYYSPKRLQELKDQGLDIKKASKKLKYTIQMPSGASTVKEFVDQSTPQAKKIIKNLIASLGPGTCSVFSGKKADGGRIGLATGTPNIDDCYDAATAAINSGKVPVDKADDFAQLLKRTAGLGRNIMKFGIIPEAMYVAADSLIRVGMGDTFAEAGLRASDYVLPGDQTKAAEMSKVSRIFGDETGELVGRTIDYKNQLAKIQSLEDQKASFENLSDGGEFSYIGDLSGDVKNTENLLSQAKNDLDNKFKVSEAEQLYAESKQEDAYDASAATSFLSNLKRKYGDSSNNFSDIETLAAPEKTQMQLNLDMLPAVPKDFMMATDDALRNYVRAESVRSGEKLDPQLYIDEKEKLKKEFMTKGPGVYGKEQVYGTQGTFGGEPVDMTNYQPNSNRFESQDLFYIHKEEIH